MKLQSGRIKYIILFVLIVFVALPTYRWLDIDICLLHRWLGIPCPTCGVTRSTVAIIRGNIKEAFILNPLWVFFMFCASFILLCDMCKVLNVRKVYSHRVMIMSVCIVCLIVNWIYLIVVKR